MCVGVGVGAGAGVGVDLGFGSGLRLGYVTLDYVRLRKVGLCWVGLGCDRLR